ncbi:mitochondrial resolvase Ydc2 [Penicillium maclennaniae]|uniref:mitochondrial resolvase Ydc2 n=1 Tax=Penicillium maclennaniae TaxID=1343394 RepID=UPI0025424F54|nr:mitochondrial resolvase Ydc2 [Penicillium maclennaniae]KAJ5665783.1 mitochondrial resolvase Ydc2 [Penicillium maclennaniae]
MHLTRVLRSHPLPWLTGLRSVQLQRVARATGIQSSGTNGALIERIQNTLTPYQLKPTEDTPNGARPGETPMSILSIDMGIQNLAFAHLNLPRSDQERKPKLTAWRRLAMSEISSLELHSTLVQALTVTSRPEDNLSKPKPKPKLKAQTTEIPVEPIAKKSKDKESFCPALYAQNAYSLINTLLHTYNPTHILIERQRFRSAGGSAVQEWTIRVGVFEGMLYAVLHALREERGSAVQVHGVEPKRVVKYWIDKERGGEKMSAREVKKAKIEIVGGWLEDGRVEIEEDVQGLVRAYLGKSREGKSEVGKLDDLADCLLQGVTWLEWEEMRARLAKDGFGGLG